MGYKILADAVVIIHFGFIVFVVGGGALTIWWFKAIYAHVPSVAWGAAVEYFGWICPLTYLEDWLRMKAGLSGGQAGFVDRYIMPIVYPPGLTRKSQCIIALTLLALNISLWLLAWRRHGERICK